MVHVEHLSEYSNQDAKDIGSLLPALSANLQDTPADEGLLKEIITSPYHTQIVARNDEKIVGIATLSITLGIGAGYKTYLEDFVVDPTIQNSGIGTLIWDEIIQWCNEKQTPLHFTSNPSRKAAR